MKDFDFIVANDSDHEQVFIEIYYNGKYIALISQEKGIDNLLIEFPGNNLNESEIIRNMPLNEFLNLIDEAVKKLNPVV
jgi:hypothetical protein